jgi:hypothetical protein
MDSVALSRDYELVKDLFKRLLLPLHSLFYTIFFLVWTVFSSTPLKISLRFTDRKRKFRKTYKKRRREPDVKRPSVKRT